VQLSAINASVPAALKADVEARRQAIAEGRFKPFSAPLVDNTGKTRLAAGTLDDAQIAGMDWLVQGVTGTLPAQR
jgi:simple sugar transport system substrate-binding protein